MPPALIDTNILIYASDPREPIRQAQAIRLLRRLDETRTGRLCVQALAEFFHASTRPARSLYTRAQAALQLERLMQTYPVFDLTPLVVWEAARGARDYQLAYYDAQIWAVARLNQVRVVFSEDFQPGQVLEGVQFINPFEAGFDVAGWS